MAANPKIRVRAYNVGFGDCFLVTIPDGNKNRSLLIDFGNAPGQKNTRFKAIAADIEKETGGHIDVVVVTHEHLDHMEGFYSMKSAFNQMTVDQVWMSIPIDPNYYDNYPKAKKHKIMLQAAKSFAASAKTVRSLAPSFRTLLLNNLSNADRIKYLRELPKKKVRYLRRGSSMRTLPASSKVKFRILAPEKDMSVYYGKDGGGNYIDQMTMALNAATGDAGWWTFPRARTVTKPANLSSTDWNNLRDSIQSAAVTAVRSLDKAANNTSLVFMIEAYGKRLLFTGDAELESWAVMKKKAKRYMKPVNFLKVSHHGSHNGTPLDLLDTLLPKNGKAKAQVLVSTKSKVYGTTNPVPDKALLAELKKRCKELHSTEGNKRYVDVLI